MRILITGGAGFIGSHLVEGIGDEGHEVVILDDLSSGHRENLESLDVDFDWILGDIRDRGVMRSALDGVDAVLHHAAIPSVQLSVEAPERTAAVNVGGTEILLEESRRAGVGRIVLASSSAVYGAAPPPLAEDAATVPLSPYGEQKLATEGFARALAETEEVDTVSLRYFNVYGPRQRADSDYAAVIPIFRRRIAAGQPPRIHGDGLQTRDFVHVQDVVEANRRVLLAGSPWRGAVLNVATGIGVTIAEIAATLSEMGDLTTPPEHIPERPGDIRHSVASIARLETALGWRPQISLDEGLRMESPVL